jgi:radical SAM protein with 4Fe4S-binding SPASM domain
MKNLSWVRFSFDAGTKETYSEIHGTKVTDFNRVIDNIKEAVKYKKQHKLKTVIGVQFLLIPGNASELIQFAKLMKRIGVDNIQIKPYSQHPNSTNKFVMKYKDYAYLENDLKKISSDKFKVFFREETMKRIQDKTPYPECYGLPFFALIDAKGNVIPCNLYYGCKRYTYGNLNKKNFTQIWNSRRRKQVKIRLRQKGCDKCREGCRLDVINRYLHRIKYPEEHDNFI